MASALKSSVGKVVPWGAAAVGWTMIQLGEFLLAIFAFAGSAIGFWAETSQTTWHNFAKRLCSIWILICLLYFVVVTMQIKGDKHWSNVRFPWQAKDPPVCCYLVLELVNDKNMAMVSVKNDSSVPVDNVLMQVNEISGVSDANDGKPHPMIWHGKLDIGTCRSRLHFGEDDMIPFDATQNKLMYDVFIFTKTETYAEKIMVTRRKNIGTHVNFGVRYEVYRAMDFGRPLVAYDSQVGVFN